MAGVRLDAVDVDIEGVPVLRHISLELGGRRHLGVVGPNGSGKSTLLALIAGQAWPAPRRGEREYAFGPRRYRDAVEARRRITVVGPELQDRYARMAWNFTALDVVLTGIFRTEIPRRSATAAERERALAIVSSFGLDALRERPFLELSRGEQRRVLIARGIAFAPDILVLDEPASGLDRRSREALDATIRAAGREALLVASAHSLDQLPAIVAEYVRLDAGRIVARGRLDRAREAAQPARLSLRQPDTPRSPATALIEVRDASVWLGDRAVLSHIDFRLMPDEHWLIVGPNGAGKSTLLRLLHGQLRPARGGEIHWPALGDPRNVWALRRQIGWVAPELQAAYRYPSTARQCIASGFTSSIGLTHALSAAEERRTTELVEDFELGELGDRVLDTLSYGQLRRVLIARTLAAGPRILLLDEPWEGLDAHAADVVRRALHKAAEGGTQIVCISHIGDMGLEFTHELELDRGRIVRAGPRGASSDDAAGALRESSANERARAPDCRPR